jgi:hypothetical protein
MPGPSSANRRLIEDPLLRLLAWNALGGVIVACLLTAFVLATDVGQLRSLIVNSDDPAVPLLLLVFGFMVTMCSVMMGSAVMSLGRDDRGDWEAPRGMPVRVPVRTPAKRSRR